MMKMKKKELVKNLKTPWYITLINKYRMQLGLVVITAMVLVLFMIGSPRAFLSGNIYRTFLSTIPFVGIMALGLTLILASGQIDLSFPSTMALSGYAFAVIFTMTESVFLGLVVALLAGALIGIGNGLLVTKIGIPPIIVTLGMMFFIRGVVHVLAGGLAVPLRALSGTNWFKVFSGTFVGIPVQSVWFLLLGVFLWFILFRHRLGDSILFIGDNEETAGMMGINVHRTKIVAFAIMGMLAAFAGVLDLFRLRTWWPTMGEGYLMTTMAAVFVGGTSMFGGEGTIFGTFIGAFLIGSLEAGIVASGMSGFWTQLIYGLLIIVSVTIHTLLRRKSK